MVTTSEISRPYDSFEMGIRVHICMTIPLSSIPEGGDQDDGQGHVTSGDKMTEQ